MGRNKSTIGRELKRNRFRDKLSADYIYEPLHAQFVSEQRKQKAWKAKHPLKNKDVYSYVMEHLREGWSPEVIAGRLKVVEYPDNPHWWVCHESIYSFIYNKENKDKFEKPLYEYLRRKQKRRRKSGGRKAHRVRIPDRVSIHLRPADVEERLEPGHWEGDSIVGKGHRSGLHTEYERVSSLTRFEKMVRITSEEMVKAALKIFSPLPVNLRKSTTLDNGSEHVSHTQLSSQTGIAVFFADPYSSYQRGGNENSNLWIRYYFP